MSTNQSSAQTNIITKTVNSLPEFTPERDNWLLWKERFEIYLEEIDCDEDKQKVAALLKAIGAEPYAILHSLCSPKLPKATTYEDLCEFLKSQYTPPTIIFRERKKFYSAEKSDGETVSTWFARIKKLALDCQFGNQLDAVVLDRFVCGMQGKIFERLCEEDETLTLSSALKKAIIAEAKITAQSQYAESEVNFVKRGKGNNNYNASSVQKSSSRGEKKPCSHCGWKNHKSNGCKFKNAQCHSCNEIGHLASVCSKKKKKSESVNFVDSSDESTSNFIDFSKLTNFSDNFANNFSVFSVNSSENVFNVDFYYCTVTIDGIDMKIACDTGAPFSLMSICTFDKFYQRDILRKCFIAFSSYGGNRITVLGEFDATIIFRGQSHKVTFIVTDTNNPPLLARNFLRKFKFELVQSKEVQQINSVESYNEIINSIKNEFHAVFDGTLGEYNVCKVSLPISSDAKPIFCPPRPIPFAWKGKIEAQLNHLVEIDVLEPVNNSDWGTPLVPIVKPNGEIRICADYKTTLNRFLLDFKYPLPRIEDIFAALQGGILFTKLDMSNAYNQFVLDDESQNLCTWSTHIGVFKMKRLPFGVKPAAAIFQKSIENLFRDIPNAINYLDDIIITGKTFKEHVDTCKLVLSKLQSVNLKLNLEKCSFFQEKVSYLGFVIDRNGLSKTEKRIESVLKAPVPKDIHEVRAFIGLINYYSRFIPDFARKMKPLYALLEKDTEFIWTKSSQESYEQMKKEVTSDQILVHFNPDLPVILETDASKFAVAGVLSHKFPNGFKKPIAFISRALSKSEINYSVIEKEALAIIFSVVKLRQYLLGLTFELATDHKPLLAIFGEFRGLPQMASARMQRWAFILSGFSYKICHIKGVTNHADCFSRLPQLAVEEGSEQVESSYINYVDSDRLMHFDYKIIARETKKDLILSKIIDAIQNSTVDKLSESVYLPFKNKANELSVELGCVLWGYRTIIPTKLRASMLKELHRSHLGIVKSKALARSYFWWPKLDSDIENLVKNCDSCQLTQPSPEKSSLIPWQPTESVWSRIHIDFAGPIKGNMLFILIDSHSKWVEVFNTKTTTSSYVVTKLREVFCRLGLVDTIVSDNGPQFTSEEFKQFVDNNGIRHILTAPGHPATNGQAENFVKTVKKSIYANLNDKNPDDFDTILNRLLADYRATKHCTTQESPFKLIFGREMKTRFSSVKPPLIKDVILDKQRTIVQNFRGKRNDEFKNGQNVFIRDYSNPNKDGWMKAEIKEKIGPRSYNCVILKSNRCIKRHLDQIRGNTDNTLISSSKNVEIDRTVRDSNTFDDKSIAENHSEFAEEIGENNNASTPIRELRPRKNIDYNESSVEEYFDA